MPDEKDELTDAERDNFGAQPEGEEPSGYVANFEGDEINGKRYKLGEKIASDVDPGTIAYLVQNGRITPFTGDSAQSPSGGEGGTGIPQPEGDSDAPTLTAEQQAEADQLVKDNNAEELAALADDAGVSKSGTKAEVAARIVAARNE